MSDGRLCLSPALEHVTFRTGAPKCLLRSQLSVELNHLHNKIDFQYRSADGAEAGAAGAAKPSSPPLVTSPFSLSKYIFANLLSDSNRFLRSVKPPQTTSLQPPIRDLQLL
eukprot:760107-Hanusia_phi.AAC.2